MNPHEHAHIIQTPATDHQGGRLTTLDPNDPAHFSREDALQLKAYELYEKRGRGDGHALDDWLEAEQQV